MSFEDLPDDWQHLPLTDPDHVADVLDLFVNMQARFDGAILVLVCDEEHKPLQPIQIDDVNSVDPDQMRELLPGLATTITEANPAATVLIAIARDGSLGISQRDQLWSRCLHEAFSAQLPVIGVHLVTPDGSRPLPVAEQAA